MKKDGIKSGVRTTEFWLTLAGQAIPILVIVGVITADEATTVTETVVKAIEAIFALTASLGILWKYIDSRAKIKVANGSK